MTAVEYQIEYLVCGGPSVNETERIRIMIAVNLLP